jgi:hypothetical protein
VEDWAGGLAQVVQRLPNKREALSSNPSTYEKILKGKERKTLETGGGGRTGHMCKRP